MDLESVVEYRLLTAADDRRAAEHLLGSGDYPQALLFGHLYLEKVLKAVVVRRTQAHAPITHNLRFLAERAGIHLGPEREAFLARVTGYSIRARYPDMAMRFRQQCTREFCEREIEGIKETGQWLEQMAAS